MRGRGSEGEREERKERVGGGWGKREWKGERNWQDAHLRRNLLLFLQLRTEPPHELLVGMWVIPCVHETVVRSQRVGPLQSPADHMANSKLNGSA